MSLKSLVQVIIILIIISILGGVYFNYFADNNKISLENNENIPIIRAYIIHLNFGSHSINFPFKSV